MQQVPSSLPPLFSGDRLVVYGLLKPSENAKQGGMNKIRLQGMFGNNEKVEHLITFPTSLLPTACVTDDAANASVFLHRLAAKTFIQVKQDVLNEGYNGGVEHEGHKTLLISVSKSANVVSKFTSFVAVDKESHQPVSGPLQRQVVPSFVRLNAVVNYHNEACLKRRGASLKSLPIMASRPSRPAPTEKQTSVVGNVACLKSYAIAIERDLRIAESSITSIRSTPAPAEEKASLKKSIGSFFSKLFSGASLSRPKGKDQGQSSNAACALEEAEHDNITKQGKEPEEDAPALLSVISLQKASGAWELTDQLASLCGTSKDSLITGCPAAIAVDSSEGKLLWATALALVLLMGKFGNKKDEWEMVQEKGKKWMKKNLPAAIKYDEVITFAAATVGVQIS